MAWLGLKWNEWFEVVGMRMGRATVTVTLFISSLCVVMYLVCVLAKAPAPVVLFSMHGWSKSFLCVCSYVCGTVVRA